MHRRRLPAGVPLPARAGVAWSGSPALTEPLVSVPPCGRDDLSPLVARRAIAGPPPASRHACARRPSGPPLGRSVGRFLRASSSSSRSPAGITATCCGVLYPTALMGFPYRALRRVDPARGCRGRFAAGRTAAAAFRPGRAHVPLASPPPQVVWPGETNRQVLARRAGDGTIPSTRGPSVRSWEARPGFWASLPRAIRTRRRRLFRRARSCLGLLVLSQGYGRTERLDAIRVAVCRTDVCPLFESDPKADQPLSRARAWRGGAGRRRGSVRLARVREDPGGRRPPGAASGARSARGFGRRACAVVRESVPLGTTGRRRLPFSVLKDRRLAVPAGFAGHRAGSLYEVSRRPRAT